MTRAAFALLALGILAMASSPCLAACSQDTCICGGECECPECTPMFRPCSCSANAATYDCPSSWDPGKGDCTCCTAGNPCTVTPCACDANDQTGFENPFHQNRDACDCPPRCSDSPQDRACDPRGAVECGHEKLGCRRLGKNCKGCISKEEWRGWICGCNPCTLCPGAPNCDPEGNHCCGQGYVCGHYICTRPTWYVCFNGIYTGCCGGCGGAPSANGCPSDVAAGGHEAPQEGCEKVNEWPYAHCRDGTCSCKVKNVDGDYCNCTGGQNGCANCGGNHNNCKDRCQYHATDPCNNTAAGNWGKCRG